MQDTTTFRDDLSKKLIILLRQNIEPKLEDVLEYHLYERLSLKFQAIRELSTRIPFKGRPL